MAEAKKAAKKATPAPEPAETGHDPLTMAHPEQDATGLSRWRVEDGPIPKGHVELIAPERGAA